MQNWFDPFHQDHEVRAWCKQRSVVYQGYSTLGGQYHALARNPVLKSALLTSISAEATGELSVSQLVLGWALTKGMSVLPRSASKERQAQNLWLAMGDQVSKHDNCGGHCHVSHSPPGSAPLTSSLLCWVISTTVASRLASRLMASQKTSWPP